jgi:hypothetical protein
VKVRGTTIVDDGRVYGEFAESVVDGEGNGIGDFGKMDFRIERLVLEDVHYVGWREGRWEDAVALPMLDRGREGEVLHVLRQCVDSFEMRRTD